MFMGGCTIDRIALNMDQIRKFKPPPNPAKMTDSRYRAYVRRFRTKKCWELDALSPAVLTGLITKAIRGYCDEKVWERSVRRQESNRRRLVKARKSLERAR